MSRSTLRMAAIGWCLLCLSFGLTSARAGIYVCDNVVEGPVWATTDSPVNVTCDLNIAYSTIEPGVEILFSDEHEVIASERIQFLRSQDATLVFKASGNNRTAGSEFLWIEIADATRSAVHLTRSYPTFNLVTVTNISSTCGGALMLNCLAIHVRDSYMSLDN